MVKHWIGATLAVLGVVAFGVGFAARSASAQLSGGGMGGGFQAQPGIEGGMPMGQPMMAPMSQPIPPAMVADDMYLYILTGDRVVKMDKAKMEVVKVVHLPRQEARSVPMQRIQPKPGSGAIGGGR